MPCNTYWQNPNFEVRRATCESCFCTFVLPGRGTSFGSCLHATVPHCLILNSQASKVHSLPVHIRCASELKYFQSQETHHRTSLVLQWWRRHLPMQGVWVWALIGELRSHMTHGQKKQLQNVDNRSNVATNSIRTLKMVHIKILKKKKRSTPYVTPNLHDFHMLLLPRTSFGSPLLANSHSSFQENAQVPLPAKALFCRSNFSTLPVCFHSCYQVFITAAKWWNAVEDLPFLHSSHFSHVQLFSTLWTEAP